MDQSDSSNNIELAVFTVPGMVAFEGQHHLLHIHEARYQQMVRYCVENRCLLGLSYPKQSKLVSSEYENGPVSSPKKKLAYQKAHEILGAGYLNIIKELDDGRFLIAVSVKRRVKILNIKQSLPFIIADAELIPSRIDNQGLAEHTFQRLKSISRDILGDKFIHFEKRVPSFVWERQDLQALLVRVMEWFRLEGHELQSLLEQELIEDRAASFIDVMELYYNQLRSRADHELDSLDFKKESSKLLSPFLQAGDNVIKVNFGKVK